LTTSHHQCTGAQNKKEQMANENSIANEDIIDANNDNDNDDAFYNDNFPATTGTPNKEISTEPSKDDINEDEPSKGVNKKGDNTECSENQPIHLLNTADTAKNDLNRLLYELLEFNLKQITRIHIRDAVNKRSQIQPPSHTHQNSTTAPKINHVSMRFNNAKFPTKQHDACEVPNIYLRSLETTTQAIQALYYTTPTQHVSTHSQPLNNNNNNNKTTDVEPHEENKHTTITACRKRKDRPVEDEELIFKKKSKKTIDECISTSKERHERQKAIAKATRSDPHALPTNPDALNTVSADHAALPPLLDQQLLTPAVIVDSPLQMVRHQQLKSGDGDEFGNAKFEQGILTPYTLHQFLILIVIVVIIIIFTCRDSRFCK
jgi:hypothetical protein